MWAVRAVRPASRTKPRLPCDRTSSRKHRRHGAAGSRMTDLPRISTIREAGFPTVFTIWRTVTAVRVTLRRIPVSGLSNVGRSIRTGEKTSVVWIVAHFVVALDRPAGHHVMQRRAVVGSAGLWRYDDRGTGRGSGDVIGCAGGCGCAAGPSQCSGECGCAAGESAGGPAGRSDGRSSGHGVDGVAGRWAGCFRLAAGGACRC